MNKTGSGIIYVYIYMYIYICIYRVYIHIIYADIAVSCLPPSLPLCLSLFFYLSLTLAHAHALIFSLSLALLDRRHRVEGVQGRRQGHDLHSTPQCRHQPLSYHGRLLHPHTQLCHTNNSAPEEFVQGYSPPPPPLIFSFSTPPLCP
jgi:hypothetical protein